MPKGIVEDIQASQSATGTKYWKVRVTGELYTVFDAPCYAEGDTINFDIKEKRSADGSRMWKNLINASVVGHTAPKAVEGQNGQSLALLGACIIAASTSMHPSMKVDFALAAANFLSAGSGEFVFDAGAEPDLGPDEPPEF